MKYLRVTSGDVTVAVAVAPDGTGWALEYSAINTDGPAYDLKAEGDTFHELCVLVACAEPQGGELRVHVEDVLNRVEALFHEWQAELASQERI